MTPPNLSAKPLSHSAMRVGLVNQPDDPGPGVCPSCGCRCRKSEDEIALKLLKGNAGRVHKNIIASAIGWSVGKLERFAATKKISLEKQKEPESTGA